jgi:hypothetical protein
MPEVIPAAGEETPPPGNPKPQGEGANTATLPAPKAKTYGEEFVQDLYQKDGAKRLKIKELEDQLKVIETEKEAAAQKKLEEEKEYKKLAEAADKRAEKVAKEAATKVESQQRKTIRTEARARLIEAEILDPDDVDLLDLSKVTWDDSADEPEGIDALVTAFKKAKPAKFKQAESTPGNGRARQTVPVGNGMNKQTGIDYRNMTTEETDKAWKAKYIKP